MISAVILWLAIVFAGYMAWNIGANDVANAMGTSVGSGAISYRQAIFLAGIFEFAGAVLVGAHVTETIRKGIIDPSAPIFSNQPVLFALGMASALLAAASWLNLATYFGLPVSTTHSIVGAVFGFGIVSAFSYIHWSKLTSIVLAWIISPVTGGIIAFVAFRIIQKLIFSADSPAQNTLKYGPYFTFLVGMIIGLAVIYKGLKNLHLHWSLGRALEVSTLAGVVITIFYTLLLHRWRRQKEFSSFEAELDYVEGSFRYLQVATACYVAFAHGANDVANAVGPLAGVYACWKGEETYAVKAVVPIWMLLLGGVGIVLGLATWGRRVIETIGRKITHITPTRGFCAEFGAATTILLCSRLGLPVSTTQVLVGSVIGVGLARGVDTLEIRTISKVISNWLLEIPLTAFLTIVFYLVLKAIFT